MAMAPLSHPVGRYVGGARVACRWLLVAYECTRECMSRLIGGNV